MQNYPKQESKVYFHICTRHRGQLNLEKLVIFDNSNKCIFKSKNIFQNLFSDTNLNTGSKNLLIFHKSLSDCEINPFLEFNFVKKNVLQAESLQVEILLMK